MSSIGSFLGLNGGQGGTGFSTIQGATPEQLQAAYNQVQSQQGGIQNLLNALQAQGGISNQEQVYNQLQQIAAGQGPNPAQAQLAQATGANVANQAALMAGQRGAGANVGLLARQAAQQGAQTQQQAVGQAASLQAQQALNAIGQAGGMAQAQTGQQLQAQQLAAQTALQNQAALQQANAAYSEQQVQMAKGVGENSKSLLGGIANLGASALGLGGGGGGKAHGGEISRSDSQASDAMDFGSAIPQSSTPMSFEPAKGETPEPKSASAVARFLSRFGAGLGNSAPSADGGASYTQIQNPAQMQTVSPIATMGMAPQYAMRAHGGDVGSALKAGGHVPGKAGFAGDDQRNDTVHAMLSPGEVVIPRSVMNSNDPSEGAKRFVAALQAKKRK